MIGSSPWLTRGPRVVALSPTGHPIALVGEGPYDSGAGRRIVDVVRIRAGADGLQPTLPDHWLIRTSRVARLPADGVSDARDVERIGVFAADLDGLLLSVAIVEGNRNADDDRAWADRKYGKPNAARGA